jgi:penicillin-binding protein 1C
MDNLSASSEDNEPDRLEKTKRFRHLIQSTQQPDETDGNLTGWDEEHAINDRLIEASPTLPPPPSTHESFPLPNRVEEVDQYITRANLTGIPPTRASRSASTRQTQPIRSHKGGLRKPLGCMVRAFIFALFIVVLVVIAVSSYSVYKYYMIARTLPSVDDLRQKASQFETTRILDRNGNTLYEILDPNAGRRTYTQVDKIAPVMIAATIATEDKEFYTHPGFDPIAMLRALYQNYKSGGTVSGASTITQQLAKALLMTAEERAQRTYERKAREIILSAEITRRYSKNDILELYLNEINYGNLAYGVEAAAETYFNTSAGKLDLAQASFLAGLPQAPGVYDIFSNREATLARHKDVLLLIYEDSVEKNCIPVSTSDAPVCISVEATAKAASDIEVYEFKQSTYAMRYPHWVNYVRAILEEQYDPQIIYRSGFTVYTTIDPALQDFAEQVVKKQVDALAELNVTNGALVAIRPGTGEILAMVGSADFYSDVIPGQVNMATSSTRQPGSSIKPFTYLAAFEKGWTPSTLIWDVPSEFPPSGDVNDTRVPYKPVNYDGLYHGPVTVRTALANSYNIPAVKALTHIGIYDNPSTPEADGLIGIAQRLGITSLTRNDYGLSLTLGGGEVSLIEMTGAYAVLANGGRRVPPVAITKIVDHLGKVLYQYTPSGGEQVVRVEHSFLVSSILSDAQARIPAFGTNPVINLPFTAAVKTGTTNDFRDNWTIGYTPDISVGVWVGNADYSPMKNTTGLTGAAPIWADFMQQAEQQLTGGKPTGFSRPAGIEERVICAVSGAEPSQWCPAQRSEYYASDQLPAKADQDLWQNVLVDTWTGLKASSACSSFTEEKFAINVTDRWAVTWIKDTAEGKVWAEKAGFSDPLFFTPVRECRSDDPQVSLFFTNMSDGQTILTSPLEIFGVVDATADFDYFDLEYGVGGNPSNYKKLMDHVTMPIKQAEKIYTWDLQDVASGTVTLQLYMHSTKDTHAKKTVKLNIQLPTPTSTTTATSTETITPTPTLQVTPEFTVTPPPPDLWTPTPPSVPIP